MAARKQVARPKRGEVYLVAFDPTLGAKIQKTRPAVVVQNDIANRWSPITIVAAMMPTVPPQLYPTNVLVPPEGGRGQASVVLLNQIRSIDTQRLIRRLGVLKSETMEQIKDAISISLGLIEV
jgi:mRNA interferase MazF